MAEIDRVFGGSIPAFYDRYLGPLIFAGYAEDLARRVVARHPAQVLETAAGTGIVTRALVRLLPVEAKITATDLNQAMLDFAAAQPGADRVVWRQADARGLPFADASFDAVLCQFGVMFFPDRVAAYREAMRVLKPGGRFLFSAWDRIEENEFSLIVTEAVATLFPEDPPQFLVRTPHGYHDIASIERDVYAAGFTRISIETVARRARALSPRDPALGFCYGSPLRTEIEARAADRLEAATDAATVALAARFGADAIDAKIQAHIVTASR
ncbi:MAG: methyltransferase domain-containing protein [Alphaproteobacteria bacterium]|nr:methyltransferase domain-containing protein [Alphaproteobacteria bacterium]